MRAFAKQLPLTYVRDWTRDKKPLHFATMLLHALTARGTYVFHCLLNNLWTTQRIACAHRRLHLTVASSPSLLPTTSLLQDAVATTTMIGCQSLMPTKSYVMSLCLARTIQHHQL